jgi:hypothetical protein
LARELPSLPCVYDVRLVGEQINAVVLTEISLVILSLIFKRDARIETKEWREEGIGAGHRGRSNWGGGIKSTIWDSRINAMVPMSNG